MSNASGARPVILREPTEITGERMSRLATRPAAFVIAPVCTVALAAISGSGPASASGSALSSAQTTSSSAWSPTPDHAAGKIGRWKVSRSSAGSYEVTWTSPTRLPYSDARPEIVTHGRAAGPSTVSADGRRVSVVVTSRQRPTVADFDVLLAGRTLDQRVSASAPTRAPYQRPATLATLAEDPGVPGFHSFTTSTRKWDPVKLPDLPQQAEMVEHVVAPNDATNASPLVVFLHGRHEPCYVPGKGSEPPGKPLKAAATTAWHCTGKSKPVPSYLGYDYVQRLLASQGYVTVSISANAINALDFHASDGGAAARAALIRHHLDHWVQLVADGDQAADLGNVILVGHSRGGEGVNRASLNLPTSHYQVSGQVLIGPTDFGFQAAPFTPTVTVLPYCDGDVSDLQGQNFTDNARDLTSDPIAFHSSILVMGANHNFFNTEWTPGISEAPSFDDWFGHKKATCGVDNPNRLSAAGQRKVGKTYIAGAVHLFADDDQAVAAMYDGSAVSVPSASNADVRSHAIGGGLDVRRPGIDSSVGATSGDGVALRLCTGVSAARRPQACEPKQDSVRTPHWPAAYATGVPLRQDFELRWTAADEFAGVDLAGGWDLSDASHINLRTIVDPALGRVRLDVELVDSGDNTAVVTPESGGALSPLPGHTFALPKRWGQTLRVPLDGVAGVDLTDIRTINLISRTPDGRVWILDMAAAPSGGITEPSGQIPLISFGAVRQDEGDGQHGTLHIPYHVSTDLAGPATLNVSLVNPFTRRPPEPRSLLISAHQTGGTFNVRYKADTIADFPRRTIQVVAYAVEGIQTDRYIGRATIIDDDPVPAVSTRPVRKRVGEGHPVRWRIGLSGPLDFPSMAIGRAVRGVRGAQLTVGDLPKTFRERHFFPVPPLDTPLPKAHLTIYKQLPRGHTSLRIGLPVRRTKSHDGARAVTFRFRVYGIPDRKSSTVRVVEPRV
jgi:hypothetical protein